MRKLLVLLLVIGFVGSALADTTAYNPGYYMDIASSTGQEADAGETGLVRPTRPGVGRSRARRGTTATGRPTSTRSRAIT